MSFRTRLTGFFVLIVVVPMISVGFLVFRLIGDSEQGKADARASGLLSTAASVYYYARRSAQLDARTIARDPQVAAALAAGSRTALIARLSRLAAQGGLARVVVLRSGRHADVGDRSAVAPGMATLSTPRGSSTATIAVSTLTADAYASELAGPTVAVIVRQGQRTLSSTLAAATPARLPTGATITLAGVRYRAVRLDLQGFGSLPVRVMILSNLSATESSTQSSQLVAAAFIAGFLLLAFAFSVLASRALQGQLNRFLVAARRLGGGDFSEPVPIEGNDEFAALGQEFNSMSSQLERRLDELSGERARLRESIRRIGQTFASNLDRPALLELALRTAADAVQADRGRVSARRHAEEPLSERLRIGSLDGLEQAIRDAEVAALSGNGLGSASDAESHVASVALRPIEPGDQVHGLITVARDGHPFSDDDSALLRSLAGEAALALENVELHYQVRRQAVTDELTGLANHGRFQELLGAELEQVRRYHHPVSLIMLDLDDFKAVNDTHGHQQGDLVLRQVARIIRENSREADAPARYGGEEMAIVLPHTDLEGAYAIAERVRTAIGDLRIRRLDSAGVVRLTASLGVATSTDGDKASLVTAADGALYSAKREGKNRTVRAHPLAARLFGAE